MIYICIITVGLILLYSIYILKLAIVKIELIEMKINSIDYEVNVIWKKYLKMYKKENR